MDAKIFSLESQWTPMENWKHVYVSMRNLRMGRVIGPFIHRCMNWKNRPKYIIFSIKTHSKSIQKKYSSAWNFSKQNF